jgi:mono/diheme cytochrome c family protein
VNTRCSGAVLVLGLVACGDDDSPVDREGDECVVSRTDEVRQGLEVTCGGCHGPNTNRPFFADLRAFEQLIAYDTRYVVRGSP